MMKRENPFLVKLIRYRKYGGQLLPILLDTRAQDWIEPLATLWAWEAWHHRKLNTVKSYLQDIALFYWWNDQQGIDPNVRLSSMTLYTKYELHSLVSFLSATQRQRRSAAGEQAVHRTTFNRRLTSIVAFVKETTDFYVGRTSEPTKADALDKRVTRVLNYLRKSAYDHADELSHKSTALRTDELAVLRDILVPGQPCNPYRGELGQWRNCALVHTLLETGARRGEASRLRLSDLDLDTCEPTITLRKEGPKGEFPRREKPSMKTRGRVLPISPALRDLLQTYVHAIRPRLRKPNAANSYVFLSTVDGLPITGHAIYQILCRIVQTYPRFDGRLKPHDLRTTAQTEIREALESDPISDNRFVQHGFARDVMTYVGGWRAQSNMVEHYTQAAIRKRLEAMTRQRPARGHRP